MKEIWKEIDGYGGVYLVPNMGRVKSLHPVMGTRILKCPLDPRGYPRVTISYKKTKVTFKVHRLVAASFIPNPDNKRTVNHKNGVKTDSSVYNLEWATDSENMKHAFAVLGRNPPIRPAGCLPTGEKHHFSKPVAKIDKITGAVIEIFPSQKAAGASVRTSSSNIARAIKNNHCDGGYRWKHA